MAWTAPDLHPKLADALDALRADGICPTDAEIVELARLRRICDNPEDGQSPWIMGAALCRYGETFYPWHRMAELWFLRMWASFDGDKESRINAYLYAHAKSAPGDASVSRLMDVEPARKSISAWRDSLPLHDSSVMELIAELQMLDGCTSFVPEPGVTDKPVPIREGSATWAARMCKAFPGVPPDYWMTGISERDAQDMLAGITGGDWATSERRTAAIGNFLKAIRWIRINHGKEAARG